LSNISTKAAVTEGLYLRIIRDDLRQVRICILIVILVFCERLEAAVMKHSFFIYSKR